MIFQVQNGSFGYHHKNILNQISFEVTDAIRPQYSQNIAVGHFK